MKFWRNLIAAVRQLQRFEEGNTLIYMISNFALGDVAWLSSDCIEMFAKAERR